MPWPSSGTLAPSVRAKTALLPLAEELHDLAALFLAGHDLDERDAVPGEDDAGHAVCDVAQRLAVAHARVEEGHRRVPTPRYVLHVGDKGIVVGEMDDDATHSVPPSLSLWRRHYDRCSRRRRCRPRPAASWQSAHRH